KQRLNKERNFRSPPPPFMRCLGSRFYGRGASHITDRPFVNSSTSSSMLSQLLDQRGKPCRQKTALPQSYKFSQLLFVRIFSAKRHRTSDIQRLQKFDGCPANSQELEAPGRFWIERFLCQAICPGALYEILPLEPLSPDQMLHEHIRVVNNLAFICDDSSYQFRFFTAQQFMPTPSRVGFETPE